MIITKINLKNFLCYYDENEFILTKGTNLIIGHNGSGKTKLFEALDWFFQYEFTGSSLLSLVTEKRKKDAKNEPDSKFTVAVTVEFQEPSSDNISDNITMLNHSFTKSFQVLVDNYGECVSTTPLEYSALLERSNGERDRATDKNAWDYLTELFPTANRKFSLFKGESELEMLKNEEAFKQLIGLYASSKIYQPYEDDVKVCISLLESKIAKESRKDEKNRKQYESLEVDISCLEKKISRLQQQEDEASENILYATNEQGKIMKFVDKSEYYKELIDKKNIFTEKEKNLASQLQNKFLKYLFDRKWLLKGFAPIQDQFIEKVATLDRVSREQEAEYNKELGAKKGLAEATLQLLGDATPLSSTVPSRSIMEELLKDELCKFCNRPAEKGSEAYKFIEKRLQIAKQELEKEQQSEDPPLFQHDYISSLTSLSNELDRKKYIALNIEDDIKATKKHNQFINDQIKKNDYDLKSVNDELNNLFAEIGSSDINLKRIISENDQLTRDINNNSSKLSFLQDEINSSTEKLNVLIKKKESIEIKADQKGLQPIHATLKQLHKIIFETKDRIYNEFIQQLEDLSNEYFYKINEGFFTGSIKILRSKKDQVSVKLMQAGQEFASNSSLDTSMNLAILFAINELTRRESKRSFPLIFDAPTSSFDDKKRIHFYNILNECTEQTVILTKDFLSSETDSTSALSEEFREISFDKAYTIANHHEGFDSQDLSTLSTVITPIEAH